MSTNPYSDPIGESFDNPMPREELEIIHGKYSKRRWETLVSLASVLTGLAVFSGSAYLMLLKNPRSNDEDLMGLAGWCFGSLLFGFGFAFVRFNWIMSSIIGILFPGLTFGFAVFIFWSPAIIAALLNSS